MRKLALLSIFLALPVASLCRAQVTFTTGTEVTALHYGSTWSAANHTTESLDLIDWGPNKTNSLSVQGNEIVAPTAGFDAYLGGIQIQPDISALLKPTNIPAGSLNVFVDGAVGVAPSSGQSKITWFAGGGASYLITPSLSWNTVDARLGQVGGSPFVEVSTGISWLFNPQASNNATIKSLYRRTLAARFAKFSSGK